MVYEVSRKMANRSHPEGGNQWLLLRLATCHKCGPLGQIPGPMVFNVFTNYPDNEIENTLIKFADDTKQGGEVNTSEG